MTNNKTGTLYSEKSPSERNDIWLKGRLIKEYYDIFKSEYGDKPLPDETDVSGEIIFEVVYLAKVQAAIKNWWPTQKADGRDIQMLKDKFDEIYSEIGKGREWMSVLKTHGIDTNGNPLEDKLDCNCEPLVPGFNYWGHPIN